jgi:pentatricopeptide repeat protein
MAQVIYTTLIHGCLKNGQLERAWETFDKMRTCIRSLYLSYWIFGHWSKG